MFKFGAISFAILVSTFHAVPFVQASAAQDIQAFLRAPAWQLEYEVVFESEGNESTPMSAEGWNWTHTFAWSHDRSLSGALTLDMRNDGPNLSTLRLTMAAAGGSGSSAQLQSALLEMMMRTDDMANWMTMGPTIDENASQEAQQAAMMAFMESGRARVEYASEESDDKLVNDYGQTFRQTTKTTCSGGGKVMPPTQLVFEIDAKARRYLLTLPITFGSQASAEEEIVERQEIDGEAPVETRRTRQVGLANLPNIVIDDPGALMGQMPFVEGDLDPGLGKVSGERSVPAHYEDTGRTAAGTLTFRYTLTPR